MYLGRSFIAKVQRDHLHLRRFLPNSWMVITLWEEMEPVEHRAPLPLALIQAMIAVAIHTGALRLAACIALIFYGITRPGEVMQARRKHLVLPSDTLSLREAKPLLYLAHMSPKTRRRGARSQHSVVDDVQMIEFIAHVFVDDAPSTKLFSGSYSVFRRQFSSLLKLLRISTHLYTPGGLRGGGACHHFSLHQDVQLLMWRMRVTSQNTLTAYLQEATTMTSMIGLPEESRRRISSSATLFHVLVALVIAN